MTANSTARGGHADRVFRAEGFTKGFGRTDVLKSASLWATAGRVSVLFGRNGSGKSTLLRCMLGLAVAETGVTHFGGLASERPKLRRLARRGLFYLPDRAFLPRTLRFGTAVGAVEAAHGPCPNREQIFERLGVGTWADRRPSELSGGEQRRCEWALALLSQPSCIVADEPLAGVTPKDQVLVCAVVREAASRGCAVIVTGHEVEQLLNLGDEIVWMTSGTTHGLGAPANALKHEQFRREYLGPRA